MEGALAGVTAIDVARDRREIRNAPQRACRQGFFSFGGSREEAFLTHCKNSRMQDVDGLLAKIDQLQQQLERLNAELARERSEKEKAVSAYNNLFKIHMDLTNKFWLVLMTLKHGGCVDGVEDILSSTSESQVPTQAPSSYSRQSSVESIQPEKEVHHTLDSFAHRLPAVASDTERSCFQNRAPIVPNRPDTRPPPRPELPPVPRSASENQIATKPLAERLNYWYTIPVSAKVRPDPEKVSSYRDRHQMQTFRRRNFSGT